MVDKRGEFMKLLIAGSRGIDDFDISEYMPENVEVIISGGAKGIDTIAEKYADDHGIEKIIIRPDYARYGRAAPIKRNEEMVEIADYVLVIWDGKSRGTKYTADYATKKNKIVKIVLVDEN